MDLRSFFTMWIIQVILSGIFPIGGMTQSDVVAKNILQNMKGLHSFSYEAEAINKSGGQMDTLKVAAKGIIHLVREDTVFGYSFLFRTDSMLIGYDQNYIYIKEADDLAATAKEVSRESLHSIHSHPLYIINFLPALNTFIGINLSGDPGLEWKETKLSPSISRIHSTLPGDGDMVTKVAAELEYNTQSFAIQSVSSFYEVRGVLEQYRKVHIKDLKFDGNIVDYFDQIKAGLRIDKSDHDGIINKDTTVAYGLMYQRGDIFPDLEMESPDGKNQMLSEIDSKFYFINFWYVSCPPCLLSKPALEELYNKYKNDAKITFLAINGVDKDEAHLNRYLTKNPIPYDNFLIKRKDLDFLGILNHPAFILLDSELNVLFFMPGYNEDLLEILDEAIQTTLSSED